MDKVDTLFVWLSFLVYMNYFQLLFVVIILEVWLIVCLKLVYWFLFFLLLLVLHYFLMVAWVVYQLIFVSATIFWNHPSCLYVLRLSFLVFFRGYPFVYNLLNWFVYICCTVLYNLKTLSNTTFLSSMCFS